MRKEKEILYEIKEIFDKKGRLTSKEIRQAFVLLDEWLYLLRCRLREEDINGNLSKYWSENRLVLEGRGIKSVNHRQALALRQTKPVFLKLTRFYKIKTLPLELYQEKVIRDFKDFLVKRFKTKLHSMSGKFHQGKIEEDLKQDLLQQATLGIFRAFDYYSVNEFTFIAYAASWIKQKFLAHVKVDRQVLGLHYTHKVTIDHQTEEGVDRSIEDEFIIKPEEAEKIYAFEDVMKYFNTFERELIEL